MAKIFLKFFSILFLILGGLIIFLTYQGIETDKFDDYIKSKSNELNKNVKLEFKKTKIHLNPVELNIAVKLQNPKVLIKGNGIDLSKLNLFLSIKSYFSSDFLLKRAEIAFEKNDIKDLTKVTNIFVPRIINKRLNRVFEKGNLEGELILTFKYDGSLGEDHSFSGKISEATINITKDFSIKNLTTEIIHSKKEKDEGINIIINKATLFDLELSGSKVNLKRIGKELEIKSLLRTNGKFNFSQIKIIASLFNLNINSIKDSEGTANLITNIDFVLNEKLKVSNITYITQGELTEFKIKTNKRKIITEYLPEYDSKIIIKKTNIELTKSESNHTAKLKGLIKINNNFDDFYIDEKYNYKNKQFNISGFVNLTNAKVNVSKLNYKKNNGVESKLNFDINFIPKNKLNINNFKFVADQTKINLFNVELNKHFEIIDFEKLRVITFLNKTKNNDFSVSKDQKITISGKVFDAEPLLMTLYKKSGRKIFSNNFKSEIKINFNKTLTGTNDEVSDFAMVASINKGSYEKLSLKGNFSESEIIEMSIYQVDNDKKTLQIISDRARPFVKNFEFIQGFEGGKLEYESIFSNKISNSTLLISDFKVSKVPALAQLLTLASLQGIADTLSGEGIRFDSFEMKSNSESNILNIEDALAIGPAVSILLEGYVDKGKTVSLRGTLVPATKLNAIIASIPLVGDILVGKKTGEGVVGVSFKMKGPPKDIKTTVNPIKTLTPRFIVRAVEKMKKKKQDESK